jgi:GNAT superfamily N-acetyltransferase
MKIFVQARKDGYNTLYPKPTPNEFRQFASDIIRIQNEPENILGKCVYSIAFGNDGHIFTKYIIVEEIQRAGLGNVGFSIFIPTEFKLSGDNIKKILDELIKSYCEEYCNDFNLGNVQEDWMLFASIANSYDSKLVSVSSEDNETKQSGNLDPAFIYFTSDIELQKYFDQPFQEEFIPYRQIYFISNEFKVKPNPENPLYVLKNSGVDLTRQIDLDNPSYKLKEFHGTGVANDLMDFAIDFARRKDFNVMYLSVWEYNFRARGFYEKHGFKNSGIKNDFPLGTTPQTDYWFVKNL